MENNQPHFLDIFNLVEATNDRNYHNRLKVKLIDIFLSKNFFFVERILNRYVCVCVFFLAFLLSFIYSHLYSSVFNAYKKGEEKGREDKVTGKGR